MLNNLNKNNKNKKENQNSIAQKRNENDVCTDQVKVKIQSKAKTGVCPKPGGQLNTTSVGLSHQNNMSDEVG